MDKNGAKNTLAEFYDVVDSIYGVYLDSMMGFMLNIEKVKTLQSYDLGNAHYTPEQLDATRFHYGIGDPNIDPIFQHTCTFGELKARNKESGRNHIVLGNLCVTQVYQYWDDYYRPKIANLLHMDHKSITSDLFGDIRSLRNAITHHRSIGTKKLDSYKLIKWFDEGEEIAFSNEQIDNIMQLVKSEIASLIERYCTR